jgi:hypothetical protein
MVLREQGGGKLSIETVAIAGETAVASMAIKFRHLAESWPATWRPQHLQDRRNQGSVCAPARTENGMERRLEVVCLVPTNGLSGPGSRPTDDVHRPVHPRTGRTFGRCAKLAGC